MFDWLLYPSVIVPVLSFCFLAFGDEAGSISARQRLTAAADTPPRRLPRLAAIAYAATRDRLFRSWLLAFAPILLLGGIFRILRPTPGNEWFVSVLGTLFLFIGIVIPLVFTFAFFVGFARTWRNESAQVRRTR